MADTAMGHLSEVDEWQVFVCFAPGFWFDAWQLTQEADFGSPLLVHSL